MENFIYEYYILPIISRTGYNMVNTLTYAVIALAALFIILKLFKKYNIIIDKKFIFSVIPFVLLGSTVRVVTDAIDSGNFTPATAIHQWVLDSHIFDYGFLTVSPGIYLVIAFLLFATMFLCHKLKRPELVGWVGVALWIPFFLLLLPLFKFWLYAIPIIVLAVIPGLIALRLFKDDVYALMVGSQALDGAATFFILDFSKSLLGISYFEQHVVSNGICGLFNTCGTFYLAKVGISLAAAYVLKTDKDSSETDKYFIALVILIMGLAPGLRDILRMMAGT